MACKQVTPILAAIAGLMLAAAPLAAQASCMVIAHRGASGYLPEHTLAAFREAIAQGADYIEPDVVMTRDGVPVVRHEPQLELTTDVADRPEYRSRRSTRTIFGREVEGWFVDDFSWEEVSRLRARERYPQLRPGSAGSDDSLGVPSLQQVIELAHEAKRPVGLYIELKFPGYFSDRGQDITAAVLEALGDTGGEGTTSPVILQSFEASALRRAAELSELPRVQLLAPPGRMGLPDLTSAEALADIAGYAQGIGAPKYDVVMQRSADDGPPVPTPLVAQAHAAGLFVHVYTFRAENWFLPPVYRLGSDAAASGDLASELAIFLAAGIDGFFIDQPDIGRRACDQHAPPTQP
jgi:glycerophosphoryl diester phosphodiesterase